jgi:hypothetical protein
VSSPSDNDAALEDVLRTLAVSVEDDPVTQTLRAIELGADYIMTPLPDQKITITLTDDPDSATTVAHRWPMKPERLAELSRDPYLRTTTAQLQKALVEKTLHQATTPTPPVEEALDYTVRQTRALNTWNDTRKTADLLRWIEQGKPYIATSQLEATGHEIARISNPLAHTPFAIEVDTSDWPLREGLLASSLRNPDLYKPTMHVQRAQVARSLYRSIGNDATTLSSHSTAIGSAMRQWRSAKEALEPSPAQPRESPQRRAPLSLQDAASLTMPGSASRAQQTTPARPSRPLPPGPNGGPPRMSR